jgi:hypothetical protein
MTLVISPKKLSQILTLVVLCLTLASIAGQYSTYFLGHARLKGLVRLFDLDDENNIPTWYSSSALLLCSILLATIAFAKKRDGARYVFHWTVLSIIFLFLSLDEAASVHESINKPLRVALNAGPVLYHTWVILGAAVVLAIVVVYWRFLSDLPSPTRRLFLTAGIMYVGGALGVELLGGWYGALYGKKNITYVMIATVEEFFEMQGIVVFIYALMSYMSLNIKEVRVRIGDEGSSLSS